MACIHSGRHARQKAAIAIRCIRTTNHRSNHRRAHLVRKHLAPQGALRPPDPARPRMAISGQKAPRAIRCIKTCSVWMVRAQVRLVGKHLAP